MCLHIFYRFGFTTRIFQARNNIEDFKKGMSRCEM